MPEKLTQDEIDRLVNQKLQPETADPFQDDEKNRNVQKKYKTYLYAQKRYFFALKHYSFVRVKEAREYMHQAAHSLWLANRGLDRKSFKALVKRLTLGSSG